MGLPALKPGSRHARAHTPRLRVVKAKPARTRRSAPARRRATSAHAALSACQTFTAIALVIACLAIGRVWLSVQAAEASMEANRLRGDIKNERYQGDMLEVSQSTLGSPSRIRAIAGKAMNMAPARKVTYMDLQGPAASVTAAGGNEGAAGLPERAASGDGLMRVVAGMMNLTAGEAQVLLVGDVGLTSSK